LQYTSVVIVVLCCMNSTISTPFLSQKTAVISLLVDVCLYVSGFFCWMCVHPLLWLHFGFNIHKQNPGFITYYSYDVIKKFITIFVASLWKSQSASHLLTLVPHSWIFLPWRWRWHIPSKRRFTQDLHGATPQKMAFFIVTAVKTSNHTLGDQLYDGLQGNKSCDATSHAQALPHSYISFLK
jgi:hypothetical protein